MDFASFSAAIGSRAAEMILPLGDAEGSSGNRTATLTNGWMYSERPIWKKNTATNMKFSIRAKHVATLNFYVPPTYASDGEEFPRGQD
ncbi:hypothetical protein C8R32_12314 [Nitrosospira sp. Nsp5]|uniref:Uncharacterized protein n=1 Tax=Nitrosospira multiformis TaxID=1231 RepID=A0ABY0TDH3_9PROT|nr:MULTISPECIES: hypothetical protein [Nitrosospira]PTR05350.1 hypothetical protein C8R32_12314 [Nitrosospira sp. Nsp5]SDQ66638.1 hypothetical protein SAMN05216402_1765 [Nitrosospira multiformis]